MPDQVKRAVDQVGQVYYIMNGPSEFHVTGVIKDWDRTNRLSEIHVPTLITSGRYDESTPRINEVLHNGIAGSEWVIFENSSHMAHIEYIMSRPVRPATLNTSKRQWSSTIVTLSVLNQYQSMSSEPWIRWGRCITR
jgi:hypothetical protein